MRLEGEKLLKRSKKLRLNPEEKKKLQTYLKAKAKWGELA